MLQFFSEGAYTIICRDIYLNNISQRLNIELLQVALIFGP